MAKNRIKSTTRIIENSPAFKRNINKAFQEYSTDGGISADALIYKLQRRVKSEVNKKQTKEVS
jgi:hypothetical protein